MRPDRGRGGVKRQRKGPLGRQGRISATCDRDVGWPREVRLDYGVGRGASMDGPARHLHRHLQRSRENHLLLRYFSELTGSK